MSEDTEIAGYILHWLHVGDKLLNIVWQEIQKEEGKAEKDAERRVKAVNKLETQEISIAIETAIPEETANPEETIDSKEIASNSQENVESQEEGEMAFKVLEVQSSSSEMQAYSDVSELFDESTTPNDFKSQLIGELVQYPEIALSALGYFYIAEDHTSLERHAKELTAWVQSMRKVIVDLKKLTQKMKDENDRDRQARNQIEEADMIFRAIIDAEIQPIVRKTKEIFTILEETPWNISSRCSSLTLTPGIADRFSKECSVENNDEPANTIQEQEMAECVLMDIDNIPIEDNAPQNVTKHDVESSLANICSSLITLDIDRKPYEEKKAALKSELNNVIHRPPIFRPLDISNEDISNAVVDMVQECIPTATRIYRELEQMIEEDNSVAIRVFNGLEHPFRTIQLLMKRFKIPGTALGDESDRAPSLMYH